MEAPRALDCPACGHSNRPSRRFCAKCGAQLAAVCASCGTQNEPGDDFCGSCGTALKAAAPSPAPERSDATEGERRQLSVLFCDLVGSTELASQLDPEEWREVVRAYQDGARQVMARFAGHIAQYLGDGIVAYFGWPQAHDDDAERAVRAGLGIVEGTAAVNARLPIGIRLAVRVGIHTGPVVVGKMGEGERTETLALGDTPNVAARVQGTAGPDTVVITAATHRLVTGLFVVEDRGTQALKGVREPTQLFRVVQGSGVRGRLHAAAARGLTPFVGREDERRLLRTRWELASDGDGQVVLVTGEAGIGKSRLVRQFKEDLDVTPHTWIECAASPFLENTPFHPIVDLLHQTVAVGGESPVAERQERIERGLAVAGLNPEDAVPLVAPLFGLPVPAHYPPLSLTPEQQRRKLMATLVAWMFGVARLQPAVLVFEDLHHADPSTLELLGLFVEQGATEQVLLLCTARPEFRPPWPMRSHHAQVTLTRLSRRQVRDMVARVAARTALPEEMVETVVARTDGVPLYVEEFVRLLLEGEGPSLVREIPATLQDSLMARLDRLGPAKEVAQVAAVVGTEFSYALLHAVTGFPEAKLQASLERLVDAELVYARGLSPEMTYLFKHTLMQDAAYASLLKSRRRELHRTIARVLAERFPDVAELQPERVAHHHTEAGDVEPAVAAWQRAGERAAARSAFVETSGHYARALRLLETLPETPARSRQELELQFALGMTLRMTKGWSSPAAVEAFARTRELSEQLGDTRQLIVVLHHLTNSFLTSGDVQQAQVLADRLLQLAEREGTPTLQVWPHVLQGMSRYIAGDLESSFDHLQRADGLYDERRSHEWTSDPGVAALAHGSQIAALLGFVDRARARARDGLALAQRIGRPYELAAARMGGYFLHTHLRDPETVLEHAEPALHLATTHRLETFGALAAVHRGWALAMLGRHGEGIPHIRSGLAACLACGHGSAYAWYLGLLAEACMEAGALAEGLATIEDALAPRPHQGRQSLPELLRLRGDLRALNGADGSQVEPCYREAIVSAREIGAKLVELRAATSLGRHLRSHGRGAEARELLAPLYAAFTEGFDVRDLLEAKALLVELG